MIRTLGTLSLLVITLLWQGTSFHHVLAEETKNVSVTATVAASASDFQTSIAKLTSGTSFPQDSTIEYEVTYGSTLSTSVNFDLVVQWSEGDISGSSSTVDIVDYVTSSASNGYGDVVPVIDLVNRKITWTFDSFPANLTDQTVRFKLLTNDGYTGTSSVSFTTASRIVGPGVTTTDSEVTTVYRYSLASPTSTPVPATPTTTTTSTTATPTTTPSSTQSTLRITNVNLIEVTEDRLEVEVGTNVATTATLYYGESLKNLTNLLSTPIYQKTHTFGVTNLLPNKTYYFRIKATAENDSFTYSDYYTIHTSSETSLKKIAPDIVQLRWKQVPLTTINTDMVLTTINSPVTITLTVPVTARIKSLRAWFIPQKVLGINTESLLPSVTETNLIEVLPQTYVGELLTPKKMGDYSMYVRLVDEEGGLKQLALPYHIINTSPILVTNKKTHKPIEHASISIKKRDERTGVFTALDQALALPQFTNEQGIYPIMLPFGSYKIIAHAPGYDSMEQSFDITSQTRAYPHLELEPNPSFLMGAIFVREAFVDLYGFFGLSNSTIITSYRGRTVLFVLNVLLLILFTISAYLFVHKSHTKKTQHFQKWFMSISAIALTDIMLGFSMLMGLLFIFQSDVLRGLVILAVSGINVTLWIQFVREIWRLEHDL